MPLLNTAWLWWVQRSSIRNLERHVANDQPRILHQI
jgi:hypothetical protein